MAGRSCGQKYLMNTFTQRHSCPMNTLQFPCMHQLFFLCNYRTKHPQLPQCTQLNGVKWHPNQTQPGAQAPTIPHFAAICLQIRETGIGMYECIVSTMVAPLWCSHKDSITLTCKHRRRKYLWLPRSDWCSVWQLKGKNVNELPELLFGWKSYYYYCC